jgi:hypothetical protein
MAMKYYVQCMDCFKEMEFKSAFWYSCFPRCLTCQRVFKKKQKEEHKLRSIEGIKKQLENAVSQKTRSKHEVRAGNKRVLGKM